MNKRVVLSLTLLLSGVCISASESNDASRINKGVLERLTDKLPACPLSDGAKQLAATTVKVAGAALVVKGILDHHAVVTDRALGLASHVVPAIAKRSARTLTRGAADLVPGIASNLLTQATGMVSNEALALAAGYAAVHREQVGTAAQHIGSFATDPAYLATVAALGGAAVLFAGADVNTTNTLAVLATAAGLQHPAVKELTRRTTTINNLPAPSNVSEETPTNN